MIDSKLRRSMVFEVNKLVDEFEAACGTNLVRFTADNPFWHTGNPVKLRSSSDYKSRQPHEFVMRVARGQSRSINGHEASENTKKAESSVVYATRHIKDHMFPY